MSKHRSIGEFGIKQCNCCKKLKPIEKFRKATIYSNQVKTTCIECERINNLIYYYQYTKHGIKKTEEKKTKGIELAKLSLEDFINLKLIKRWKDNELLYKQTIHSPNLTNNDIRTSKEILRRIHTSC